MFHRKLAKQSQAEFSCSHQCILYQSFCILSISLESIFPFSFCSYFCIFLVHSEGVKTSSSSLHFSLLTITHVLGLEGVKKLILGREGGRLTGSLRCYGFRPLVARVLDFLFLIVTHLFSFSLMLREREAIAATVSMHITLQIPIEDSVMAVIG